MYIVCVCMYMLRPDSQPLAGFETFRPASKLSSQFWSWLLVLYDEYTGWNFTQAVHRKELGNNSTHDILCNKCSQLFENDRHRAQPLRLCKQASTALVSVQPVSESTNYCPVSASSMSTSRFRSRPPSRFQSGPLPFTGYESGRPVLKLASRLRNGPGWESGLNIYITYVECVFIQI